ncbi:unnamed protein product [Mytilus coruscus]|uniref:HECT domain-containing protein n=1 Tax=Mytilus coruscus TaxID=42192 RepID=A0A6J8CWE2_MYTCO|nr:unnamed protein product [Mytilus coruscus]
METDVITFTNPEVVTNKQDVHIEVTVRVQRGHVLLDMIRAFKSIDPYNDIISFEMIMPNGCIEIADDDGGVTRDSLTEFWKDFYEQCTEGTSEKVLFLRHDFGDEEWRAVAKIVVFGWARQGYFPIQLSLPFVQQCNFGFYSADLLEGFYKDLPEHERVCLQMSLSDFTKVDEYDFVDILDSHGVRHLPNQLNIARIIMEIAHKEIIQTPTFVSKCWYGLMGGIKLTEEQLINLYAELKPTPKAVYKRLCFPCEMKPDKTVVSHHLKRFIRERNEDKLGRFVRFCTGSVLLISKKISVEFVNVSGLARRPVSHM